MCCWENKDTQKTPSAKEGVFQTINKGYNRKNSG